MKDPETCTLFEIYSAFASEQETLAMRNAYANGIGWGDMKGQLFEYLNEYLTPARKRYDVIIKDPSYIEAELQKEQLRHVLIVNHLCSACVQLWVSCLL